MTVFINAVLVVWRESFEAFLVVYLVWVKMKDHLSFKSIKKSIFASTALGVILSIVFGGVAMTSDELFDSQTWAYMQGFLPAIAAVLMLQMIVWMNQHAGELKAKITQLSRSEASISLSVFLLILITISREGFETVVFLSVMALDFETTSQAVTVLGGALVVGLIFSCLTVAVMIVGKTVLNLALFFFLSNLILLFIAAEMLTVGFSHLMDLSVVPMFNVTYAKWLFMLLGVFLLRKQFVYFFQKKSCCSLASKSGLFSPFRSIVFFGRAS